MIKILIISIAAVLIIASVQRYQRSRRLQRKVEQLSNIELQGGNYGYVGNGCRRMDMYQR